MKTCPNCRYIWPDDYNGQCVECGKPLGGVESTVSTTGDSLGFAFARQIQNMQREEDFERQIKAEAARRKPARPGDARDTLRTHPAVFEKAREMIVQREEVQYAEE